MKERKEPKYYEPRTEWVEITAEDKKKILELAPGNGTYTSIGKSIRYSAESIRRVFVLKPDRVNKVVWDAIMVWYDGQNAPKKAVPAPAAAKKVPAKKAVVKKTAPKTTLKALKDAHPELNSRESQILAMKQELSRLGTGPLAKKRADFLNKEIKKLESAK